MQKRVTLVYARTRVLWNVGLTAQRHWNGRTILSTLPGQETIFLPSAFITVCLYRLGPPCKNISYKSLGNDLFLLPSAQPSETTTSPLLRNYSQNQTPPPPTVSPKPNTMIPPTLALLLALLPPALSHFTLDSPPARGFNEDQLSQFPCGGVRPPPHPSPPTLLPSTPTAPSLHSLPPPPPQRPHPIPPLTNPHSKTPPAPGPSSPSPPSPSN